MRLNADFSQRVAVRPDGYEWVTSPVGGVDRMMLDRIGEEVARATTIVRFAPNSYFDAHTHGGGEEFLVLDGVFSDQYGDFPAGTYVRNPIGTSHKPHTEQGCTILVKLHQFDPSDMRQFHVDINSEPYQATDADGVTELPLHKAVNETVRILRLAAGAELPGAPLKGGEEIFVIEGEIADEDGTYPKGSWLRSPDGARHDVRSETGAQIWVKTGHLSADIG